MSSAREGPSAADGIGPIARIDPAALAHNLRVVRDRVGESRVLAVVKADAYGHGALAAARALAGADGLAVARAAEALHLRRSGMAGRILVLGGFADRESLDRLAVEEIDTVVHSHPQIEMIRARRESQPVRVWVKVDTGMHRLGFSLADFPSVWRALAGLPGVAQPVHAMSHLASADEPDGGAVARQVGRFDEALAEIGGRPPASLANSAGVLAVSRAHRDWVRPGLMLYGASPMVGGRGADHGLRPAMTLSAPLVAVKRIEGGAPVGYGGTWTAPEPLPLGLAAIGYADGYPRHVPSGTAVLVNGRRAAIAGRVSMDLIAIDLRACPDARSGDRVILWGDGLPIEEVAEAADTIPYELMARLGPRVGRRVR